MSRSFFIIVSVFFFWGFVAASNDILIPVFKNELHLEQWQSQLVSFAFYIAYTVGALLYYGISALRGRDLLNTIGYKNGMALGLCISAAGTLLFIPAANLQSFYLMISGLFVVGLGFSLQQTAANPLTIRLGDPASGSQRLSLAGGINNIGTTIGPVLISMAIFGEVAAGSTRASLISIQFPYLMLGAAFLLVAALIKFSSIPDQLEEPVQATGTDNTSVWRIPRVWMGMLAIFLYVGVEVSTAGNLGEYLQKEQGLKDHQVAPYISLFWASLMIGRWTSAAGAFKLSSSVRRILGLLLPFAAFLLFLFVNQMAGHSVSGFFTYAAAILVLIGAEMLSKGDPARQLLIFSMLGITALAIGMLTTGMLSVYAFLAVGLFCSTLWPCIFTLAISGMGEKTNQVSGLLVMMIMGGGIVSLIQGRLAGDDLLGIRYSYIVGVLCFAYLAFYALKTRKGTVES